MPGIVAWCMGLCGTSPQCPIVPGYTWEWNGLSWDTMIGMAISALGTFGIPNILGLLLATLDMCAHVEKGLIE